MMKTLSIQTDNGVNSLLRVLCALKRKRFSVSNVSMSNNCSSGLSDLFITINDDLNSNVKQAINQIEKLADVCEVKELREE